MVPLTTTVVIVIASIHPVYQHRVFIPQNMASGGKYFCYIEFCCSQADSCLLTLPFLSPPPPSVSSHVPSFLRIGPVELILSQLLRGLSVAAFVARSDAERSSSPLCSLASASPSINSNSVQPSVIRHGGRRGRKGKCKGGCVIILWMHTGGLRAPKPESRPTSLTCFFMATMKSIYMG